MQLESLGSSESTATDERDLGLLADSGIKDNCRPATDISLPRAEVAADVLYLTLPSLTLDNVGKLDSIESAFLEAKACFRVPKREYLECFVQAYFLRVHPLLPLLEEYFVGGSDL